MKHPWMWWLAKGLEGIGMVIVLVGVVVSMRLGFDDQGLASMRWEMRGLLVGGALFFVGWMLERSVGGR